MKCPTCGATTEGINHNGRGLRCTACWALLPKPARNFEPKPEAKPVRKKAE